ncbi:histidine phosphatase family protein [Clostridiaceae bacterium HSG29]|nr:histidine phosphatase family protein [Clostridiaceae bacterium HSG29]
MRKIYFVRHGETNANIERRYCGFTDIEINEQGIIQAKEASEKLKDYKIDLFFSSDLIRTRMTANEINKNHNLDIVYLKNLREMNFGELENLTFKEIGEKFPEEKEKIIASKNEYIFPSGESLKMLYERTNQCLKEILNKYKDGNILIVSHSGAIESMLTEILSGNIERYWNIEIENCKISTVVDNQGFLYLTNLNV